MSPLKCWPIFALITVLGLIASCASTSTQPSTSINLYDGFMAEQRQWAGLTSKQIQLRDGLDIHYSEGGPADAPVLILLHGFYGDRNNWNSVAYHLRDQYHLIIPDLPGHGDSSTHPDGNYSFAESAFVLSALVDALHIEHFHLAGHSMGGGIAIQWTLSRGSQIDSLILVDSAGKYRHNTSTIAQQMLAGANPMRIAKPGDAGKVLAIAMATPPFIPQAVIEDFERKQLTRAGVYDQVMADLVARDKTLDPVFFSTALKLFTKPALIIWGQEDRIFSANVADELTAELPKAHQVILQGVGHSPILEAPRATADFILEFFATNGLQN